MRPSERLRTSNRERCLDLAPTVSQVLLAVDDWTVPCLDHGGGSAVVLNYSLDKVVWGLAIDSLAGTHRVLVPEWDKGGPPGRWPDLARWFPVLLEAVDEASALLVTWSLGAPAAVAFARSRPGGLSGLVLIDPAGLAEPPAPFLRRPGPPPPPEVMARNRWSHWVRNPAVDRKPLEDALVASMARSDAGLGPARVSGPPTIVSQADLGPIPVPTVVFAGQYSDVLGPGVGRSLAHQMGADLVIFDDSAHAVQLDEPDRFATEVRSFVDSLGQA